MRWTIVAIVGLNVALLASTTALAETRITVPAGIVAIAGVRPPERCVGTDDRTVGPVGTPPVSAPVPSVTTQNRHVRVQVGPVTVFETDVPVPAAGPTTYVPILPAQSVGPVTVPGVKVCISE